MPTEHVGKVVELLKNLQEQVCKDGAWVENKGALLTFHYRETPVHLRKQLADHARRLIEEGGFKPGDAHCAIEAKPPVLWNKGRASIYILRTAFGVDWSERIRIIYVGDDVTDEDAMQVHYIWSYVKIFTFGETSLEVFNENTFNCNLKFISQFSLSSFGTLSLRDNAFIFLMIYLKKKKCGII